MNKALETGGAVVGDDITIKLDIEVARKAGAGAPSATSASTVNRQPPSGKETKQ